MSRMAELHRQRTEDAPEGFPTLMTLDEVFQLPLRSLSLSTDPEGRITVRMQREHCSTSYCHEFSSRETMVTALRVAGEAEARSMRYEAAWAARQPILNADTTGANTFRRFGEGMPEPATFVPLDVGDDDQRHGEARLMTDPRD